MIRHSGNNSVTCPLNSGLRPFLPDASEMLFYYLTQGTKPKVIKLQKMIQDTENAKTALDIELAEALAFAKTQPCGSFDIMSQKFTSGAYYQGGYFHTYIDVFDSLNWNLAIGGYSSFGKAKVIKRKDRIFMDFQFKLYDIYNFDSSKASVGFFLPSDATMGKLQEIGFAREFKVYGLYEGFVLYKEGVDY